MKNFEYSRAEGFEEASEALKNGARAIAGRTFYRQIPLKSGMGPFM